MPHTGQKCEQSGIYDGKCGACAHEMKQIALSKGDTFPPCAKCKSSADWTLAQATR